MVTKPLKHKLYEVFENLTAAPCSSERQYDEAGAERRETYSKTNHAKIGEIKYAQAPNNI